MPRDVTLDTRFGRFRLVPRHAVLALDEADARRLLERVLDEADREATLRRIAEELGCDDSQPELLVAEVARALASGRLVAIEVDRDLELGFEAQDESIDWETIPSLNDLIEDPPTTDLLVELVFDDGSPLLDASYELELPDARRVDGRVGASGRVRELGVPPGVCRLELALVVPPARPMSNAGGGGAS